MTPAAPEDCWWSEAQIAAAQLPATPATQRGVHAMVRRGGWRDREGRAEKRRGVWFYHESLLPDQARAEIALRRARAAADPAAISAADAEAREGEALWSAFAKLTDVQRDAAGRRAAAVRAARQLEEAGYTARAAVDAAAVTHDVSPSSLWVWRTKVAGVRRDWWAPILADGRAQPREGANRAEMSVEAWGAFKGDWLRFEKPSLESAWRRTKTLADKHGWVCPGPQAFRRRVHREVPRTVIVALREGGEAVKRLYPPQVRDRRALAAMQVVNADGHKWDVFVRWADGTVGRPIMIAWQDVYSGKFLGWRFDREENMALAMMSFGDVLDDYGIPDEAVLDNGRAYASKWFTGGTPTRYRFKVREDDPEGVLTSLGVKVHWATPYSGQSKPIERAFRDFCDDIAKHPAFAGAYVGNKPDAKPENYGSRAVPIDEFEAVVAQGIIDHNAREGRTGGVCAGRSFDQVFAESYAETPIRKATSEQRRMLLMGAEDRRADRESGAIWFLGNVYWGALSSELAGRRLIVRFDWERLHDGLHVYDLGNRYLGHLPCMEKGDFISFADAKAHGKARRAFVRAVKEQAAAVARMEAAQLAALHRERGAEAPETPETRVVRPRFGRGGALAVARESFAAAFDEEERSWADAAADRGIRLLYSAPED